MEGFASVPDRGLSLVKGIPLEEEPGLGSLTLPAWLREVTERYGTREAIAQPRPDGEVERWSYTQLWQGCVDVARALIAGGLGKGDRVGILATNRVEFITSFLGANLAGGIAVPLSTFSTPSELDQLLTAACCSTVIVEPEILGKNFVKMLAELEPQILHWKPGIAASKRYPFLRHLVALDRDGTGSGFETWDAFLASGKSVSADTVDARAATVSPADAAAIFFSSGSTGKPKGIINSHRAIAVQLWRWPRIFALDPDVRAWPVNGFFWSAPFGMGLGGALSIGGTLVLLATFDPEKTLELIESEKVTCPMGWPHQWAQIVAAPNYAAADLSSLVYIGRENPLNQHHTVNANWHEPTRIYGNTETFTLSTGYCSGTSEEVLKGAHGFPLPGMVVKVVDPLTGVICPTGERGELAVKGATLMMGYVGIPLDETLDDEGYFATGDGGYVDDDGRVYWEGRLSDIIKTGGANVSPEEVNAVLAQCPGIKIAKTIGVPDDLLGEIVVACVVTHSEAEQDEAVIRDFAKTSLASFKVPRRVLFLSEDELHQTGSAKIKTSDLRDYARKALLSA